MVIYMKNLFLIAAFALLMLSGCSKEGYDSGIKEGYGAVSIGLESSGEFTQTKAESVEVADFYVKILKGETVVKSFNRYADIPNAVEVTPGTYTIQAGSHGNDPAAFDQPVYFGEGDFTVQAGKVVPVDVKCTLQNMKVTIKYTEAFGKEISDNFEIAVTNGTGNLVFTKTIIDNNQSGYFSVGPLSIRLNGTRKSTGEEILHSIDIPDGKAQDHFVLTFDAQETGDIQFGDGTNSGITIDYTVNNRNVEIIVPGEDETPIPDDCTGSGSGDGGSGEGSGTEGGEGGGESVNEYLPAISGDGITTPVQISKSATDAELAAMTVDINIATLNSKTINDILVTISSNPSSLQEAAAALGLSGTFSIVNFDDATGADRKALLIELGLIKDPATDPIKGQSSYVFKIGSFMSALAAVAEPGTCNFEVKVIDSQAKESTANCIVNIVE